MHSTFADNPSPSQSAYETLYALMETAFTRINTLDLWDRVVAGLRDDNEIRALCNLMVSKLAVIDADETSRRLDAIAECYRATLSVKLKDGAVRQDVEKHEEAVKSVLRVTLLLAEKKQLNASAAGGVGSGAGSAPAPAANQVWAAYWDWVNKDFERQLRSLRDESREVGGA